MPRWTRNRLNIWAEKLLAILDQKYPAAEMDMGNIRRHDLLLADQAIIAGVLKAKLAHLPRLHVDACTSYGEASGIMLALGMIKGTELDAIERY